MLRTGLVHRTVTVGLAAVAATGFVSLAGNPAQATTTISCQLGLIIINGNKVLGANCAGFVDSGAPYVFQIATLTVWDPYPLPGTFTNYQNAVATCSAYSPGPGYGITGTNCTIQY